MAKKIILCSCLLFMALACSSLSKNVVKKGSIVLRGGRLGNLEWETNLRFERISWYKELTMFYDLLVTEITPDSPFYAWFSKVEQEIVQNCKDFRIMMGYALDPDKIGHSDILSEFEKSGFKRVAIPNFKVNLVMHPNFEKLSMQLYQVYGICQESEIKREKITFILPGFREMTL